MSFLLVAKNRFLVGPEGLPKVENAVYAPGPGDKKLVGMRVVLTFLKSGRLACRVVLLNL